MSGVGKADAPCALAACCTLLGMLLEALVADVPPAVAAATCPNRSSAGISMPTRPWRHSPLAPSRSRSVCRSELTRVSPAGVDGWVQAAGVSGWCRRGRWEKPAYGVDRRHALPAVVLVCAELHTHGPSVACRAVPGAPRLLAGQHLRLVILPGSLVHHGCAARLAWPRRCLTGPTAARVCLVLDQLGAALYIVQSSPLAPCIAWHRKPTPVLLCLPCHRSWAQPTV